MTKHYPDLTSNPDLVKISNQVLEFWQREKIFEKSVEARPAGGEHGQPGNEFVFFDGPPFANGSPHYGHLLTGFVKDIVARYQTLKGKRVERKFGWDCHGLPVEMEIEKRLEISGRLQITQYGIDKFNEACKASVINTASEWREFITKQARWVDMDNAYRTMDLGYMESVIWAFKRLYDKGLVYKAERVLPYSWACQTPLSNFEARLDNSYREVVDKAITVKFKLKAKPNYYLLAWTTTPWTLPSNLALAVSDKIKYVRLKAGDEYLILAKSKVQNYTSEIGHDVVEEISGTDLIGLEYCPIFDYFKDHANSFKVFEGDFVTDTDGTGIVHLAPGFGEDDHQLCQKHGIKLVCPIDDAGKFTQEVPDFAGMQVFDANVPIIKKLKERGSWIKTEQYVHNYPHCWRTDTPLIYRAMTSWYIKVTEIKSGLIAANKKVNWIPEHIRDGLFGKWLEAARDWSVSRNRFWGTPIPIWESDDKRYPRVDVYGSIAELEQDFKTKITDLHRPQIDNLARPNPDDPTGKSTMRRVSDILDCWFDSGSMPYAEVHYPFENEKRFKSHALADFVCEYVAQTRGWFYTLMVLSVALFDKPAFLNCICHGVILDTQGRKLSKRYKNYADPMEIFNKYGSDALRFVMASSQAMRGQELYIDADKMVQEMIRLTIKPIWNAYNFFTLYANADGIKASVVTQSDNVNDKYILSKLKAAIAKIETSLDGYDLPSACNAVDAFFEVLNNWYIRRNRVRFWKSERDNDKQSAYDTLYTVLHQISIATSPLLPLLLEHIYTGLVANGEYKSATSVHLQDYPDHGKINEDPQLVEDMDLVRDVCTAAHSIRNTHQIRTRQPLLKLIVASIESDRLRNYIDLIKDEVNVKDVELSKEMKKHSRFDMKLNFKVLSTRLASKMQELAADAKSGKWSRTEDGKIKIAGEELRADEFSIKLEPVDNNPSTPSGLRRASPTAVVGQHVGVVILDTEVDNELAREGFARDIVRLIQQARKKANLHVSDRIIIEVDADEELRNSIKSNENYIMEQTLATQIHEQLTGDRYEVKEEQLVEGHKIKFGLKLTGDKIKAN